jgi:hypothetical protein
MLEINSENTVVSGLHISTPSEPYRAFIDTYFSCTVLLIFFLKNLFLFNLLRKKAIDGEWLV